MTGDDRSSLRAVLHHPGIEGTGLGLSVVLRLVMDHAGAITIDSEVGKVDVPRAFPGDRTDAIDASARLADGAARGNGEHILYR